MMLDRIFKFISLYLLYIATSTIIFILAYVAVYIVRNTLESNEAIMIADYYKNKMCAESSCENPKIGCSEYCYNKEVLGK